MQIVAFNLCKVIRKGSDTFCNACKCVAYFCADYYEDEECVMKSV